MKKVAVILILLVVLLSMGSAYARWTDSTSVTVTARNAIIIAGITGRNSGTRITSYNVCYTKLLRIIKIDAEEIELITCNPSMPATIAHG